MGGEKLWMPAKYSDVGGEMVVEKWRKIGRVSGAVSFSGIFGHHSHLSSENSTNLRAVVIIHEIFGKLFFRSSRFDLFINSSKDRKRSIFGDTVLAECRIEAVDEVELLFRGAEVVSSFNIKNGFVWGIHWRLIEILSKVIEMGFVVLLQLKAERVKESSSESFSQFSILWGAKVQRELCDKDYPLIVGVLL